MDETAMNSDLFIMYTIALSDILVLSEGQHSAVAFIFPIGLRYAWLSDLLDAYWFESNSRDETAMNSDLFIMYIIASSEFFCPIRETT